MLKSSSIGVSISGEAVNFVKLKRAGNGFLLDSYGERKLSRGAIEDGVVNNFEELIEILQSLKKKEKVNSVHVALPLEEESLFAEYIEVFREAGMTVKSFEPEEKSILRSVIKNEDMGAYMIVNVGKFHTGMFFVSEGFVSMVSGIDIGGETIMQITKGEYGLSRSAITSEVSSATLSGIHVLRDEIHKRALFWNSSEDEDGRRWPVLEKIIVCGSEADMPGLAEYFSVSLKMKVELANVWINILDLEKKIPEMTFKESLSYTPALGAALKGFG